MLSKSLTLSPNKHQTLAGLSKILTEVPESSDFFILHLDGANLIRALLESSNLEIQREAERFEELHLL
jgi:hypothetical protein